MSARWQWYWGLLGLLRGDRFMVSFYFLKHSAQCFG